jgi:hypothetical protein
MPFSPLAIPPGTITLLHVWLYSTFDNVIKFVNETQNMSKKNVYFNTGELCNSGRFNNKYYRTVQQYNMSRNRGTNMNHRSLSWLGTGTLKK